MTDRQIQELINLIRYIQLQYQLDDIADDAILNLQNALNQAKDELYAFLKKRGKKITDWSEKRALALLEEIDAIRLAVQAEITGNIGSLANTAEGIAMAEYNDILSVGGAVEDFNRVSLTGSQIRAVSTIPVGGFLLDDWVEKMFGNAKDRLRQEITAGMLKGEGYPKIVKRFSDMTKQDAITLARTYVQTANVEAQKAVYDANKDIIRKVRWSSALEAASKKTGRGTCIRCAGLDGEEYDRDDHPPCPLHPR